MGKTENDMLSLLPLSTPAPPHKSVLVGDIKMPDFKQFLESKGIQVHKNNNINYRYWIANI